MSFASYGTATLPAQRASALHRPWWRPGWSPDRSDQRRPLIVLHGHDATSWQSFQGGALGLHLPTLCDDGGHVAIAPDLKTLAAGAATAHSWPSPPVMQTISDAYAAIVGLIGGTVGVTRVGLFCWSGGGGDGLVWAKQNPDLVAALWAYNPLTDVRWAYSEPGYVPDYAGPASPGGATWTAEIDEQLNGYAAHGAGYLISDERAAWRGLDIPMLLAQGDADTTIPPDGTRRFVEVVADPLVQLRVTAGGHSNLGAVPSGEVAQFFGSSTRWRF